MAPPPRGCPGLVTIRTQVLLNGLPMSVTPTPHTSSLTVEGEDEARSPRQAGVLRDLPGADRGGDQRGSLLQALLLFPVAEESGSLATKQVIVLPIAQVESPSVAAPVEAEVIEPSRLWE